MSPPLPFGRWVPPAYTPVPLSGLTRASIKTIRGQDERGTLAEVLAERYDAERVVLTDSGTHALQLAFLALAPGDYDRHTRVALPAFACFDLVTAVVGADVEPVFYDITPRTLEPDWSSFEAALAGGVDAVVVAPLFGLPGGWPQVRRIADRAGVPIVEDAAQGFGSFPDGYRAGSLGDVSVLSFGRGKGWTGGGGGALLLRRGTDVDPWGSEGSSGSVGILVRSLGQALLGRPSVYGVPASIPALHLGETRYHPPTPPQPMVPASASLVLGSLEAAEIESERRRTRARRLIEGISGNRSGWCSDAGYLRLPILMPDSDSAASLAHEQRRLGVERSYPTALPELDGSMLAEPLFSGAKALASRLVSVPTHSGVRPAEVDRLCDAVTMLGGLVVSPVRV